MSEEMIESLKQELAEAKQQAESNLAGWQRAQADYSNLLKDRDKNNKEIVAWSNAMLMAEILPVYNHFKLALKHIPESAKQESWIQGIEMIQKQFRDFLEKYKISEIASVGKKFDHNYHEAVAHETVDGFESDVIFEEVQPGYLLGEKVLIPAKVKVAK